MPRSPPGMSPANPFSATSCTPASRTARSNAPTSASGGTAEPNGHHASTAVNPAARAAAGRSSSGSSVNSMDMFASSGPQFSTVATVGCRRALGQCRMTVPRGLARAGRAPALT
jgi:hypothetical protein